MNELRRLIFINWFLADAEEIDVAGTVVFIGHQGSGKTSFLDALMTTVMGGNVRNYLNVGVEGSKRTVKAYCLAAVREDKNLKESANTYIALGFKHSITGDEYTLGVALYAERDSHDPAQTVGRFLLRGTMLHKADFLEDREGRMVAPRWDVVRRRLRERFGREFIDYRTGDDFVTGMLMGLGPKNNVTASTDRFIRYFKNSRRLRPIKDPTEFVRDFILDEEPIKIDHLRDSYRLYSNISAQIAGLKTQAQDLRSCLHALEAYAKAALAARRYRLLELRAELGGAVQMLSSAKRRLAENRKREKRAREDLAFSKRQLAERNEILRQKEIQLNTSDISVRIGQQKNLVDALVQQRQAHIEGLNRIRSALLDLVNVLSASVNPPASCAPVMGSLRIIRDLVSDLKADAWMERAVDIDRALAGLGDINVFASAWRAELIEQERKSGQITSEIGEIQPKITDLERGASPLNPNTRAFIRALHEQGISTSLLCDVADVRDESWRGPIESLLGHRREAVIVSSASFDDAKQILKADRAFEGCHLVNTTLSDRGDRPQPGSVAAMLEINDDRARAWVNRQYGNIILLADDRIIRQHPRALSKTFLYASGGTITRLRRQPDGILGARARAQTLAQYRNRLAELSAGASALRETVRVLDELVQRLQRPTSVFVKRDIVSTAVSAFLDIDTKLQKAARELEDLEGQQDQDLVYEIELLKNEIAGLKRDIEPIETHYPEGKVPDSARPVNLSYLSNLITKDADISDRARAQIRGLKPKVLDARREVPLAELGADRRKEFTRLKDWRKAQEYFHLKGAESHKQQLDCTALYTRRISDFCGKYAIAVEGGNPGDPTFLTTWVQRRLERIEQDELIGYEAQAKEALEKTDAIFRKDFVDQLADLFKKMDTKIRELNRVLENITFGNDVYAFTYTRSPAYAPVIRYIERVRHAGAADEDAIRSDPELQAARESILKLLMAPDADLAHLEDYRNYFTFEMPIKTPDGRISTNVSSSVEIGSGGETQAPFYVATCASLASGYHQNVRLGKDMPRGMGLTLFDEAFSKLDPRNIANCLRFMKTIGLQAVIATPEDKRPLYLQHADTIVEMRRKGRNLSILVKYPSERARAELSKIDPENVVAMSRATKPEAAE